MNHRTALVRALSLAIFAVIPVLGCNALLSNEEGTPRLVLAQQDAAVPVPDAAPTGDAGGQACDTTQGNKVCFGLCVKIDQPNTGCGGASCSACDPKNVVTTTCKGGADTLSCAYDACRPGFDSCDGQVANGCETSLGAKSTCGSCTTKCEGATPFCAVTSNVAGCVASCPAGTTECTGSCVDTASSVENCGQCGLKCVRASATATCTSSKCVFTCVGGTHACGTVCASDIDPKYCGASCVVCPSGGANTVATCASGSCGSRCAPGYLDCDGNSSNGCEVNGAICPLPIGECRGGPCAKGEQCCNDACVPDTQLCAKLPPPPPF